MVGSISFCSCYQGAPNKYRTFNIHVIIGLMIGTGDSNNYPHSHFFIHISFGMDYYQIIGIFLLKDRFIKLKGTMSFVEHHTCIYLC